MSEITFSLSSLLETSWVRFKENPILWISITILSMIVGSLGSGLDIDPETFNTVLNPIGLVSSLLSLYISASITLMYIQYTRGESISLNHLLAIDFKTFIHYVLATIFSAMLMIIGFVCFILPGFYIMARLIFVQYLVVDQKLNFDQAIKKSWEMSDGYVLQFIGFYFTIFFVIIVGVFAFLIGLLVAIPIISLATAQLYLLFRNHE